MRPESEYEIFRSALRTSSQPKLTSSPGSSVFELWTHRRSTSSKLPLDWVHFGYTFPRLRLGQADIKQYHRPFSEVAFTGYPIDSNKTDKIGRFESPFPPIPFTQMLNLERTDYEGDPRRNKWYGFRSRYYKLTETPICTNASAIRRSSAACLSGTHGE